MLVARSRTLVHLFEPVLSGMFAVPLTMFFPLFVLFFGIGPDSKVAYGAVYAFFPIALNTIAAFSNVDEIYLRASRAMGASGWQQFRYVYLPAALPVTLTGLRIGFFICIASVLGGETLAATAGVGRATALAAELMETARALRLDRVRGLHVGDAQSARARRRDAQRAGVSGMSPATPSALVRLAADPRRRSCCGSSTRGCSRPRHSPRRQARCWSSSGRRCWASRACAMPSASR